MGFKTLLCGRVPPHLVDKEDEVTRVLDITDWVFKYMPLTKSWIISSLEPIVSKAVVIDTLTNDEEIGHV